MHDDDDDLIKAFAELGVINPHLDEIIEDDAKLSDIPEKVSVSDLTSVGKMLNKDIKLAGATLGNREARFLVDGYYMLQANRIRAGNQVRDLTKHLEPSEFVKWFMNQSNSLEDQIKMALGPFAKASPAGEWAMAQKGIGPVISAGLLANISVEEYPQIYKDKAGKEQQHPKAGQIMTPTASHLWSFCGLNPNAKWEAGKKRPWNATLKVLSWKIGHSFVLQSSREGAFYGQVYAKRKALEIARNNAGDNKETAAATLKAKKFKPSPTKTAYEAGVLPDGRIDLRASRYAAKLFLAHFHTVLFQSTHGRLPPNPYILSQPGNGHTHYIPPPGWVGGKVIVPKPVKAKAKVDVPWDE